MKNIKFLSFLCVLCLVFSLFTPIYAVNRAPEDGDAPDAQNESKLDTDTKEEASDTDFYAGADMVNSIWGFKYDTKQAEYANEFNVPVCLSHNRESTEYDDFVSDVIRELGECVDIARAAGIPKEKIILDPGVGFGKTVGQNLSIMNHLDDVIAMGYPVLLGTSRKSVIGVTLGLPPEQRLEGTLATTAMAVLKGAMFLRVHDIKENKRAVKMIEAIKQS